MPSFNPSTGPGKTQFDHAPIDSVSDDASSELSHLESSGSSATKEISQGGNESDGISFGSSSGDSGNQGGIGTRKTLKKKPRSTRLGISGALMPNSSSPNYLKATSCSEGKKMNFQASLHDSESSCDSIGVNRRNSISSQPNKGSSSLKSMPSFRRSASLRPLRILLSKSSFKSKKTSMKKCPQGSEDWSVNRGTCSSTLKDSKFPHCESESVSAMKVCPYNYCFLHGHHHSSAPTLKRLKSKRRRLVKTQKSIKLRRQSSIRAKYHDDIMSLIEGSQLVMNGESELQAEAENGSNATEATEDESVIFSDSVCHTVEDIGEATKGGNGDFATDHESVRVFEHDSDSSNVEKSQLHNKQHSMWHLIHQHKVSKGAGDEKAVDDTTRSPPPRSSGCSSLGFYDSYEASTIENHDTENQESEHQHKAEPSIERFRSSSEVSDTREATEDKGVIFLDSVCHTVEEIAAREGENEDLATHYETVGDSEPNSNSGEKVPESQLQEKKHISMWHLIHQHMVSEGAGEEKPVDDTTRSPPPQSYGCSFSGFSDSYQTMSIENHDTINRETEHQDKAGPRIEFFRTSSQGNDTTEETEDKGVVFPDSICHTVEEIVEAREGENGDLATCYETVGDSKPNSNSGEVHKSQLQEKKHISMWHLIHHHMASKGAGEEKPMVDTTTSPPPHSSGPFSGFSDSYDNTNTENPDTDTQEAELHKMHAIKMVRAAIEKILLPEVEDHSEQELVEKTSNFPADKISGSEQQVLVPLEGGKGEKKAPKGWSNLKKLILLKRFIKALEKVREFNPRKPQNLPLELDPEAEKVHLKPQMMDRKKSSEEWMLDYAIQQVVSELAPTEKRKVELLIKAFETVVPPSEEQQNQVTFPKFKGIGHEGFCTESDVHKCALEETYGDTRVEISVTSDLYNGAMNSITTGKQSSVRIDGKAEQEVHKDMVLTSNLEILKDDFAPGGQTMNVDGLNVMEKSIVADNIASSASDNGPFKQPTVFEEVQNERSYSREKPITINDQKSSLTEFGRQDDPESNSGNSEIGNLAGASDGTTSITESEAAVDITVISSACDSSPMEEHKNGDSELESESIEGFTPIRDSKPENSGHKAYKTELGKENHVSMWHLIHQHMVAGLDTDETIKQSDENEEHVGNTTTLVVTESEEVELRKSYAIKLVQEAIEKILLPEVQDQSSDDQSVTSDVTSDQELIENSHCKHEEPSISTSRDFSADIAELENDKAASEVQNKSEKQTPKGWSNLKKLILLRRFIKELVKVRKFNPKKPRFLPLTPDPEAEKVRLRNQMMDERQCAEEWMLDYALRKVVSELAPKQKRKVALLVKAFETVALPSDEPQIQVAENDEDQKEGHKHTISSFSWELLKEGSEPTCKNKKVDVFIGEKGEPYDVPKSAGQDGSRELTATYSIASSVSDCDPLEQIIDAKEKKNGDSETDCMAKVEIQLDKQKHISMWHLLCQHVVSDIATKVETQFTDREYEDEQVDGAETLLRENTDSCHEGRADDDRGKEDHDSRSQRLEFSKSDAVKLVKEAIDEILVPEIQDESFDAQSVASEMIPQEKNQGEVGKSSILTCIDAPKDSFKEQENSELEGHNTIKEEQKGLIAQNIPNPDEERSVSTAGDKSELRKPTNWSKLKKIMLLKRSIRALEKARKSNPCASQNLPLKPEEEAEKVGLRHRASDEKKKAEEWMLDYALQHLVTNLTPARKKRVSMLVEAFEAVVPLPEV